MRVHILGICGTFMSGVALLAKQHGHEVTGSDMNIYPPISTQLMEQNIKIAEGYEPENLDLKVDCVIVGNVIRRGNPAIEYVLTNRIPYQSGPQWLKENILKDRWVLAVSGTHGKTTTTSMLTWILEAAGLKPGFLIGGIPENFGVSARIGNSDYFVIEADEYDTAFFDKRSKFIHYQPKTLILNNLEYDHADIFPDLNAIKQQFHYMIRTVPNNGLIIHPAKDIHIEEVLKMGCWTPHITFGEGGEWQAELLEKDGSHFKIHHQARVIDELHWSLLGKHNIENALAAISAAHHIGIKPQQAIQALSSFKNVKRRLEVKGKVKDITVYDDFAHHPTAIATTLAGLRAKIGECARMIAVVEFGSYTMRSGVHKERIREAFQAADKVVCKNVESNWGLAGILSQFKQSTEIYDSVDKLVAHLVPQLQAGDHVVVMSNTGFGSVHEKILEMLKGKI